MMLILMVTILNAQIYTWNTRIASGCPYSSDPPMHAHVSAHFELKITIEQLYIFYTAQAL